jgi:branched-chain amino acid transport system permease protein
MSVTAEETARAGLPRPVRIAGITLAVLAFLFLVYVAVGDQFWAQTRNGLVRGSIYAMIALGYTMVYGVLQLINFAHSEIFLIGTVTALFAIRNWFGVTEPQTGIALILILLGALIPAMLASGLAAVALERLAYRPLRKRGAPRLAFLISAIGASFAISYLFRLMDGAHSLLFIRLPDILGPDPKGVPVVLQPAKAFSLFGAEVRNRDILVVAVAVIMMIILDTFVRKTRAGRGIRSVAQDSETAALMGVNIDRIIMITFLIGGLMAGAAGLLHDVFFRFTRFTVGFLPGIKAFTAAVVGGIGNLRGAMAGGLLLGLFEAWGSSFFGQQWRDVIAFVVLVIVLMFRPTGIFGEQVGS